ncbi:hypothetical protein ACLOJK_022379 [Asimina triloba]
MEAYAGLFLFVPLDVEIFHAAKKGRVCERGDFLLIYSFFFLHFKSHFSKPRRRDGSAKGATRDAPSVKSARKNYVTLLLDTGKPIYSLSFAFGVLRRSLPEDKIEGVKGISLTADGKGAVFDVLAADVDLFLAAVGPTMVVTALMFIVRHVGGHKQIRPSDPSSFTFIYSVCLVLAAYLMGVMLVEDLFYLSYIVVVIFTVILFILLLVPIVIHAVLSVYSTPQSPADESLLLTTEK